MLDCVPVTAQGFFWLACRSGVAWQWSVAGCSAEFGPWAQWRADAVPRSLWPLARRPPAAGACGWQRAREDR